MTPGNNPVHSQSENTSAPTECRYKDYIVFILLICLINIQFTLADKQSRIGNVIGISLVEEDRIKLLLAQIKLLEERLAEKDKQIERLEGTVEEEKESKNRRKMQER